MLDGTDMTVHGDKVAAGLRRYYKFTSESARALAEEAYPWLVERFEGSDEFGTHWALE
jgi:hypothetical protein